MTAIAHEPVLRLALANAGNTECRSAAELRRKILVTLRQRSGARTVLFLGYADTGASGPVCTGVLCVGAPIDLEPLEGAPVPFGVNALLRPAPHSANRFTWVEEAEGLPPCLVATFFAGDEVLGSVVVVYGDRVPARRHISTLDAGAPALASGLRRAADFEDDAWRVGGMAIAILGGDGHLGELTGPAARQLDGPRRRRLEAGLRSATAQTGSRVFVFEGLWVAVEPLTDGGDAPRHVLVFTPCARPLLAADHALTPRQREVCWRFVQGVPLGRIADELGVHARSVARLVQQSYDRLGVSDPRALAALLTATPPELVAGSRRGPLAATDRGAPAARGWRAVGQSRRPKPTADVAARLGLVDPSVDEA